MSKMTEIEPGVFVGNSGDSRKVCSSQDEWVVLNCAFDLDIEVPGRQIHYVKIGMVDGEADQFRQFVRAVECCRATLQSNPGRFLVHCHMGMSRSVTVLATAIAANKFKKLDDVLNAMAILRPIINPNGPLLDMARRYLSGER